MKRQQRRAGLWLAIFSVVWLLAGSGATQGLEEERAVEQLALAGHIGGPALATAAYGDYALVGAQGCDLGSNVNQGAAYVFHRNGTSWSQQAKLTASDGDAGDRLGCSVSMDGEYALVGAYSDAIGGNTGQGSAYVFKRDGGRAHDIPAARPERPE